LALGMFILCSLPSVAKASVEDASFRLACFFFDQHEEQVGLSVLNPGLPNLWAKGAAGEEIHMEGQIVDGFFHVRKMKGVAGSSFFGRRTVTVYDNDQKIAINLCNRTLQKAFPDKHEHKTLLKLGAKSNFLSMRNNPPVFKTDTAPNPMGAIKKMVIFGDSMSDWGNLKNWLRLFPREPYFAGRFSDGPVWVDYFGKLSRIAVQNFAVGGAVSRTSTTSIKFSTFTQDLRREGRELLTGSIESEINRFELNALKKTKVHDAESTMFFIWAGGNDYLYRLENPHEADTFLDIAKDPDLGYETFVNSVTDNLMLSLNKLYELGGRNFMMANLPDLGLLPHLAKNTSYHRNQDEDTNGRVMRIARLMKRVTRLHNRVLNEKVQLFARMHPDAHVIYADMHKAVNNVLINRSMDGGEFFDYRLDQNAFLRTIRFSGYELKIGVPCYKGSSMRPEREKVCKNPDQMLFWDDVHPTSLAHGYLGSFIHQSSNLFNEITLGDYRKICVHSLLSY
jgi:thermolabile hemolysin